MMLASISFDTLLAMWPLWLGIAMIALHWWIFERPENKKVPRTFAEVAQHKNTLRKYVNLNDQKCQGEDN